MQPLTRQRLLLNFALVLAIGILLFAVNLIALIRVKGAAEFSQLLDDTSQVMAENRSALSNYALSGDPGELARLQEGNARIKELLSKLQVWAPNEDVRGAINELRSSQTIWMDNFAAKLVAKRQQVDSGHATLVDVQVTYLSLEPAKWTHDPERGIDRVRQKTAPNQTAGRNGLDTALRTAMSVMTLGSLVGLFFGALIAYRTAEALRENTPTDSLFNSTVIR